MNNIAIFASGNGTNAERIIKYFSTIEAVDMKLVLTNNPKAGVLQRAEKLGVETCIFNRDTFRNTDTIVDLLRAKEIDLLVLAGFLWLIPSNILDAYSNRIINIHPALLPKYGGKGMYGQHVHEAVIASDDKKSGITIHFVNEKYDDGQIIFQKSFEVDEDETPESLASKIHELEYEYFPMVIEELIGRL